MLRVVISLERYRLESQLIEKPNFQVKVYFTSNKYEVHLNLKFERKSLKFWTSKKKKTENKQNILMYFVECHSFKPALWF